MNRLSAQMQMYIAIGVIVLVTVAFVFLAILPKFQEASAIDDQIAAAETQLQTANALLARRQSIKAQSAVNEVELMRIANQIPDSPQLPAVIIELQDVANAAGVEIPTIAISDIGAAPVAVDGSTQAYSVLPLTLTYSGQWSEVIDFNRRLNALNRGLRVKSGSFTYSPAVEEISSFITANGTVEVYVMQAATSAIQPGQ